MANTNGNQKSVIKFSDAEEQTPNEPLIEKVSTDGKQIQQFTISLPNDSNSSSRVDKTAMCNTRKLKSIMSEACSTQMLFRRLPIISWLPKYNRNAAVFDLIAGITVGLTIIPQSMAYAAVAGLPLEYGLYSSFMGLFAYAIFGSVKESSIGPTAVMSLMTFSYANEGGPAYVALLSFLAGWVELVAGLLNLGFMVEFISAPVISGFCSAAALTVASTQIKGLFGLRFKASSVVEIWTGFFSSLSKINPWDASLGCAAIVALLLMRKLTVLKNARCLRQHPLVGRFLWFISTSRNAVAVIGGCLAAYLLAVYGFTPFTLTGDIKSGLPPFELPPFSINRTDEATNSTISLGFVEICSELGAAIGLIPLIAILEQVAIAKAFACGKRTDATQEMIALGVGNVLGSFFGAIPITASFGRSSVQSASGVKTPLSNVYAGVLVLFALGFLMPSLAYIPKPILSAVIITSVIFMFEYEELKPMWNSRRLELFPFLVTFFCCLLVNMEIGILIGAGVHLLLMAYSGSIPQPKLMQLPGDKLTERRVVVVADKNLYFPGVEKFREVVNDAAAEGGCLEVDLSHVNEVDYTSLKMLKSFAADCRKKGHSAVRFTNASTTVTKAIASAIPSTDIVLSRK